jgi:hypothetical protein
MRFLPALLSLIGLLPGCDRLPGRTPPPPPPASGQQVLKQEPKKALWTLAPELERPGPGAPAWARGLRAHHPQSGQPKALFQLASALRGEKLEDVLLLFEVHVTGRFDDFQAPDLLIVLERAGSPRVAYHEKDNRNTGYLSLRATLSRGDELSLLVGDRDATTVEKVGTARLTYAGELPIRVVEKDMTVELRALAREQVEAQLGERLSALDKALAAAAKPAPDPLAKDLGLRGSSIPALRALLEETAALAGWTEPRVATASGRTEQVERRFERAVKEALAAAAAKLPPPGEPVAVAVHEEPVIGVPPRQPPIPVRLRVVELDPACAPRANRPGPCLQVTLEVENRGDRELRCDRGREQIGELAHFQVDYADGKVARLELKRCAAEGQQAKAGPVAIAAGGKVRATFTNRDEVPEGKPLLLRAGAGTFGERGRLLRLQ